MGLRKRIEHLEARMENLGRHSSERSQEREKPYLHYGGQYLYSAEAESCADGEWIMDGIIDFWQWYLEQKLAANFPLAQIELMRPSLSLFLTHQDEFDAGEFSALKQDWDYTHLFVPINDASTAVLDQANRGNHWSLLVVSLTDGIAFHYNSCSGSNAIHAERATEKLSALLGKRLRCTHLQDCPQQTNDSDCGVFVCMFMEKILLERLLRTDSGEQISVDLRGVKIDAKKARRRIRDKMEVQRKRCLDQGLDLLE